MDANIESTQNHVRKSTGTQMIADATDTSAALIRSSATPILIGLCSASITRKSIPLHPITLTNYAETILPQVSRTDSPFFNRSLSIVLPLDSILIQEFYPSN